MAASGSGLFAGGVVAPPSRKRLAQGPRKGAKQYFIELVSDGYSYSLQIVGDNNELLHSVSIDPTDCTLATAIDWPALSLSLGEQEAEGALEQLSQIMREQIGGKQLILLFGKARVAGYYAVDDTTSNPNPCPRLRHGTRDGLLQQTQLILDQYPVWVKNLDQYYHFVSDARSIFDGKADEKRCQLLQMLLSGAGFTEAKQQSYQAEDGQRLKSRLLSKHISSVTLVVTERDEWGDKREQAGVMPMHGMVRALHMSQRFAYLSDEVIRVPEQFLVGLPPAESQVVLLAYLINRAVGQLRYHSQFVIIAAKGREDVYDKLGFKGFHISMPSQHDVPTSQPRWTAVMNFSQPKTLLQEMQRAISALPVSEQQGSAAQLVATPPVICR